MSATAGHRFKALVVASERLGAGGWRTVEVPGWPGARPGQFALLQAELSTRFLARPLSVAAEAGTKVSFLIAPIGPGTRELCALDHGAVVWVLGPLGNGFPLQAMLDRPGRRLLLVAGGVGRAPFPLLLSRLLSLDDKTGGKASPGEVVIVTGARDGAQAEGARPLIEAVAAAAQIGLSWRVVMMTEDGSVGGRGLVTDALTAELSPDDRVAVCGPAAMSEAVWSVCSRVPGVRSWFSLETGMACGVGSCHGCVITLADGSYARVCAEGPVFEGERVWGGAP